MGDHSDSEISQAWANAQHHMPTGWRITDLRDGARCFHPSPVAAQAKALHAEHPRADHAGDPWKATATGAAGQTVEKAGRNAPDALERMIHAVRRAAST